MSGTIIITGATSGIGRATAELFAEKGWVVGAVARRADVLDEMAMAHDHMVPLAADVSDPAAVEAAVSRFVSSAGRLDVLFNNAGMFGAAEYIDELSLETWDKVVSVNLHGMFLMARAAFGQMRRQDPRGGRIINNGSISAHVPRPKSVAYTTTKHAITGLTKALSLDGRELDIGCGQIDIGNARTPMVEAQHERARAAGEVPDASMDVSNVTEAVHFMATRPLDANVQFMTVMAREMPFIGRG
ncbi:SDR family NAD(P)-dependent oxidoreductase [Psychromarinibacter sp. C21-152]|uniref:SDR family NAD(P)-dependent oxidoreductase n=1 Tax=Psychromarinibacter sediminicola TaxID=3033385 RepID=A0AAE3NV10_9RHOB|nr:SDR family oxidoreductase [Psychromarinibacter sediminicola]MDF0602606.1 SDR family NAD(P)-dependent oxidoreductase [Psychromarinibacter sediminicola]